MPPHVPAVATRRSIEAISIWALLITFVAAIIVFIPSASVPFLATKTFLLAAGTLVTLALYILARLGRGNIIFPPLLLVGALWLPVVAYVCSAAFGGASFSNALWGLALEPDTLGFMLSAAFLGTLAALMLRRPEHYRSFLRTAAIVFGVVALAQALVVIVGQFSPATISPAFSLFGTFEDLAFFLGLGVISVLITLRFLELSRRAYQWLIVSALVALVLLAIANSSLVWTLLALVSLGLFVEAVLKRAPRTSDADLDESAIVHEALPESDEGSHSLVIPLAVLAISLFFLIGGTLGGALANSLNVNYTSVRPSWQSTFAVANKTYASSPVFGTGPGTFGANWLSYRDASLNSTIFWNVDFSSGIGFVPTSLVTTGVLGVLAWTGFFLLLIWGGIRTLIRRAPTDVFVRYVAILSFVGAVYLFTLSVFSLPGTVMLVLAFVFAGIFASTTRFAGAGKQWGIIFSRSPRIGFVIVFFLTLVLLGSVVAAYTLVEHYIANVQVARATGAYSSGDLDGADRAAQNAISFAPSAAAYDIQAAVAGARLDRIVSSTTMPVAVAQKEFQTALSGGINAALTATRLAPADYQNWLVLGDLYARAVPLGVTDAYASAKTAYDKARVLNPTNPQIPYILAQLEIANKNPAAAEKELATAITLKQDYTTAIFLLSQLQVQGGKVKEALNSSLAAAYFTPNNPNILFQVGILYAAQNDFANAAAALVAAVAANPQFANARYFLSAVYAKQGNFADALKEMQAIAAMSTENAQAVTTQLAALQAGKNPFPANLLSVSSTPVQ